MRRDAYGRADAKRIEAQGERDAAQILSGEKTLADFQLARHRRIARVEERLEPEFDLDELPAIVQDQHTNELLRREVNVAKALLRAEEELHQDPSPAPERTVDGDWIRRWRDYAGEVSAEDLQQIWGRLLAGEVKAPGSHSLRTLDLIRNLSTEDAELIAKLAPFVLQGFIFRLQDDTQNRALENAGFPFGQLLYLEEIGILSAIATGLKRRWPNVNGVDSYQTMLNVGNVGVLLSHSQEGVLAEMPGFSLTKPAIPLINLCNFTENREYFEEIGQYFKSHGFKAEVCDLELFPDGTAELLSRTEL